MPATRFLLLVVFSSATLDARAVITPIAVTGDTVPGLPGAEYSSFDKAQMNANGHGAYTATLRTGPGGITPASDKVLVSFNGGLTLNAQTGSGAVAGAGSASYETFMEFKVTDTGDVLLKAQLAEGGDITHENKEGFWQISGDTATSIVRTGTDPAPGVPAVTLFDLGARVGAAKPGNFAFNGQLTYENGATSNNDFGVWHYSGINGALVARENSAAPEVVGGLFHSFGQPVINSSDQIAFRAAMKPAQGMDGSTRLGVWVYNDQVGELIARSGSAEVPGSTSDYTVFEDPLINEAGHVVVRATLATGQKGLWLYTDTDGTNLAITNVTGIPGLPAASFASLDKPLLTESGQVVALGTLTTGVGDVTSNDDTGLWLFDHQTGGQLLAREGIGGVPGIADASFASFERITAIDDTGVYLHATIQGSPGVVESSNNEALWRVPFDGVPELILRKGDTLEGRTIADLSLALGAFDEAPITGIANASGELLFHASFTNGDSGLLLYSPGTLTEFADADFDQDGDVDGADLATWQAAYGANGAGDANNDGQTDGADFLTWQRQFTGPGSLAITVTVPEPGVSVLLMIAAFTTSGRTGRKWLGER